MRIAIIGAGAMGSWFINSWAHEHELAVFDPAPGIRETLPEMGVQWLDNIAAVKEFQPQLLLDAVSIAATIPVFEEVLPFLPADCLLADITSVKGELPGFYSRQDHPFVSLHPMFGPRFADLDYLKNENVIIISQSDTTGKEFFNEFFRGFDVHVYYYSFEEHDRLMARSLALPFTASFLFAAGLKEQTIPGTTYKKHLEISRKLLMENDDLLASVMMNPATIEILERMSAGLEFLKHVIKGGDYDEMKLYFKRLRQPVIPLRNEPG